MKLSRIAWAARSLPEGAFASKEELFKYGTRGGSLRTRPQRAGGGGGGAIRRPKLECFSLGLPRRHGALPFMAKRPGLLCLGRPP